MICSNPAMHKPECECARRNELETLRAENEALKTELQELKAMIRAL